MGKFNLLSFIINYQTTFPTISNKWKMFQMAQMKEENMIIDSKNSLQCGYSKIPSYHWKEF